MLLSVCASVEQRPLYYYYLHTLLTVWKRHVRLDPDLITPQSKTGVYMNPRPCEGPENNAAAEDSSENLHEHISNQIMVA